MSDWFNWNHLKEAKIKAGGNGGYWWHFKFAIIEALWLFIAAIGSLIHAFFPWLIDFKLLKARIKRLKYLKSKLPHDPDLKRIHFDE